MKKITEIVAWLMIAVALYWPVRIVLTDTLPQHLEDIIVMSTCLGIIGVLTLIFAEMLSDK